MLAGSWAREGRDGRAYSTWQGQSRQGPKSELVVQHGLGRARARPHWRPAPPPVRPGPPCGGRGLAAASRLHPPPCPHPYPTPTTPPPQTPKTPNPPQPPPPPAWPPTPTPTGPPPTHLQCAREVAEQAGLPRHQRCDLRAAGARQQAQLLEPALQGAPGAVESHTPRACTARKCVSAHVRLCMCAHSAHRCVCACMYDWAASTLHGTAQAQCTLFLVLLRLKGMVAHGRPAQLLF